jgi:hypothetical protein
VTLNSSSKTLDSTETQRDKEAGGPQSKADHANLQRISVLNLCFMFLDREAAAWPHLAVKGKTHFYVVITQNAFFFLPCAQSSHS